MAVTLWQRLGGFVYTGENLSDATLANFAAAGGFWLCPVIYGDDVAGPWNLANLDSLRARALSHGVSIVGAWCNCFGGDPQADARNVAQLATEHNLPLVILDLEAAYQYPQGNANLMPELVKALRDLLPHHALAVSTNGLNASMVWNGRTLTPRASFAKLGIRVLPQWYSGPGYWGCWTDALCNTDWLRRNGASDPNFADPTAPRGYGVPLSYVHGTLEATGVEGSSLAAELSKVQAAVVSGYTYGLSLYTLERTPDSDFDLLRSVRNRLYK